MTRIVLLLCFVFLIAACGSIQQQQQQQQSDTASPSNNTAAEVLLDAGQQVDVSSTGTDAMHNAYFPCHHPAVVGEKAAPISQMIAMHFEPFKGTCLVIFDDPESEDPRFESGIAIQRWGKHVASLPDPFNGVKVGCWVEAVTFQDVNDDRLTDVIVVGKCSGKSDSFNENTIYINDGRTFVTRLDSNYELANLKTVKDVAGFAKANPKLFSRTDNATDSNRQP